ncbi:hypothetical protein [Sphingobium yanoikuyae]|uniref:Uncharacterized protein n=2 Tax=Sphingomonadaceae TaxID=41297 RepID=A0A9X7YCT9_SPHYA|nr:hypothetical protein [Sphingobium yanoikuyae]QNG46211.1 hypothetical protein H3V42_00540 [Sphingobium yanoikuyae]
MARIEDQPRPKHRIAILFIASMRKQTRNHYRNHFSSKSIFPHHHFNSAQTETELLMALKYTGRRAPCLTRSSTLQDNLAAIDLVITEELPP